MACIRITISLNKEQYEFFREILPDESKLSEVIADMITMFVESLEDYGDEYLLDKLCSQEQL